MWSETGRIVTGFMNAIAGGVNSIVRVAGFLKISAGRRERRIEPGFNRRL
jgi:hypothetical protein